MIFYIKMILILCTINNIHAKNKLILAEVAVGNIKFPNYIYSNHFRTLKQGFGKHILA
jgi:hypothetical protein